MKRQHSGTSTAEEVLIYDHGYFRDIGVGWAEMAKLIGIDEYLQLEGITNDNVLDDLHDQINRISEMYLRLADKRNPKYAQYSDRENVQNKYRKELLKDLIDDAITDSGGVLTQEFFKSLLRTVRLHYSKIAKPNTDMPNFFDAYTKNMGIEPSSGKVVLFDP